MVALREVAIVSDVWSWAETEQRVYASGILTNKQLLDWFEGYLRYVKEDTEARLWLQDLIRETEYRRRAGDPFPYHPTSADGISQGDVLLGCEILNSTPYRFFIRRGL